MVLHSNQPEIQFIGLLEFVSDEYLCCSSVPIYTEGEVYVNSVYMNRRTA
jgi:hypothetical protein